MPAGADAGASTGVAGALATTDAEGNDGSEAGVAKLAGAVAGEAGAASCCCLEHAASVKSNADDKTNGADFIQLAFKVLDGTPRLSGRSICPNLRSLAAFAAVRRSAALYSRRGGRPADAVAKAVRPATRAGPSAAGAGCACRWRRKWHSSAPARSPAPPARRRRRAARRTTPTG